MSTKKRVSATEPIQDGVVVSAQRVDEETVQQPLQEKVLSANDRILELTLIIDGLAYRRQLTIQSTNQQIRDLQQAATDTLTKYDKLLAEFDAQLKSLQGQVKQDA